MRQFSRWIAAVCLVGVLQLGVWAGEPIPLSELPKPVVQAIQERFPQGEMLSAERETDDGQLKFEVKVRSDGKVFEVDVTPDGQILSVDEED